MNSNPHSTKYRADIDGLRALAVLGVVLFHAFPKIVRGGFIGVDVFFVISGFLITSIIVNDLNTDNFSFRDFYGRRIKRIFPALITVLVACLAAGWFLLLGDEYAQLGKHTAAGAGFIANFVFWKETSYFSNDADLKILLHLWSLGVEEQYYLLWPVLVWTVWKRFNLFSVILLVVLGSFYYNIHTIGVNAPAAFYSPVSRFWELLVGSWLGYVTIMRPPWVAAAAERVSRPLQKIILSADYPQQDALFCSLISFLGVVLFLIGVIFLSHKTPFPGRWAILPTLGTFLILLAGPQAWFNRVILSSRVLVKIGFISYPLYLWHWPLLSFARNVLENSPSALLRGGLVLCSFPLAWLTYFLIERPIRSGEPTRMKIIILCAVMTCIGGFGYYIYKNDGVVLRLGGRAEYLAYFDSYIYGRGGDQKVAEAERELVAQNPCNFYDYKSAWRGWPTTAPSAAIDPECYTKHTAKSVLIWGDSEAADLYYGLKTALPKDVSTLLIFSSGCLMRRETEDNIRIDHCGKTNQFGLETIKANPPDVVLISSVGLPDIDYLRSLTTLLLSEGVKHVMILGNRPNWKPYLYKTLAKYYWPNIPRYLQGHQDPNIVAINEAFKKQIRPDDQFEYVDLSTFFCKEEGCLTYLGDNSRDGLITYDYGHFRPFASVYLSQNLLVPKMMSYIEPEKPAPKLKD